MRKRIDLLYIIILFTFLVSTGCKKNSLPNPKLPEKDTVLSFVGDSIDTFQAFENQSKAVVLESNVNWTIFSGQNWITFDPAEGIGTQTINISVSPNVGPARKGFVRVSGMGNDNDSIIVIQLGISPFLKISDTHLLVDHAQNSNATFSISSNTYWTISSNSNWLSTSSTKGFQSATVTLTVGSNTGLARQAIVTVTDSLDHVSIPIKVIQAGVDQTLSLIPPKVINSSDTGFVIISVVSTKIPQLFAYKNNMITSVNLSGYILSAGQETPASSDNFFAGSLVSGNKVIWNGADLGRDTHGLFNGFNQDITITYNYLKGCPYGLNAKSSGLSYSFGGIAYNVVVNSKRPINAKGMNGVKIYNNSIYSSLSNDIIHAWGLISIYTNDDAGTPGYGSANNRVFNNIFYTKNQVFNIRIDQLSLPGFQCDYNLYYCESGTPMFYIEGRGALNFSQWQALGYDTHSVVRNPNFVDFNTLVPSEPLSVGVNLGNEWSIGLDKNNQWKGSDPMVVQQGTTWQVGAYIVK